MNATYLLAVAAEGLLYKGIGPWMGMAGIVLAIKCLVLVGVWLTTRYIPNNLVGVVEKLWSSDGSVAEGCTSRSMAKPATRPICCAAAITSSTRAGSIVSIA
jgi:hypothetical protein